MSDVIVTLTMLIDGLKKKEQYLSEVLNYTKAQQDILLKDEFDLKTFNNIMENKQYRIDSIVKIDEGFEPLYERIRVVLESNPKLYQEYINTLQEEIKKVSDLTVSVQVLEQKNHTQFLAVTKRTKGNVKQFRTQKKTVGNYYKNFNKQHDSVRSNIFDSKK